jgi:hypothetical protein
MIGVSTAIETPMGLGAPTPGGIVLGTLTQSSGSVLVDAAIGAGVGWLVAPEAKKPAYIIGGAAATGLLGILGLAGLLGVRYAWDP